MAELVGSTRWQVIAYERGRATPEPTRLAALAAAVSCPRTIELVYVDAPTLSAGDFGWWHDGFSGWERTRDWAFELLHGEPRFDGIFGFSQGAALTGLLAAVHEGPAAPPEFDFEFAIVVGGFTSTLPQHADLFRHKLTVPSAHVIGRADVIVPARDSLVSMFDPEAPTMSGFWHWVVADLPASPSSVRHPPPDRTDRAGSSGRSRGCRSGRATAAAGRAGRGCAAA